MQRLQHHHPAFAGTGLELQERLKRQTPATLRRFRPRRSARSKMGRNISKSTVDASFSSGSLSRDSSSRRHLQAKSLWAVV